MQNVIGFHNPEEENGFLSNWYPSVFSLHGQTFSSAEQYMMHQKAVLCGDTEIAAQVLATRDPAQIKALGRAVRGYDDRLWCGVRQLVVCDGLTAKFGQNSALSALLLGTGDALLAECAVQDTVWGIGLAMHDPRRLDPAQWNGHNLLGFTLMQVRRALRDGV